jgi:hypothetical protein
MTQVNITPARSAALPASIAGAHEALVRDAKAALDADKRVTVSAAELAVARNNTYDHRWFEKGAKQTIAFEVDHKMLNEALDAIGHSNVGGVHKRVREAGFRDACERSLFGLTPEVWENHLKALKAKSDKRQAAERVREELKTLFVFLHKQDENLQPRERKVRAALGTILNEDYKVDLATLV